MQETFKKIIEKLEEKSIFMTTCDGYGANCVSVGTIEEIVKQEAEKFGTDANVGSNGWIPCSERLPEGHKLYDITFKNSAGIHSDSAIYNPYLKRWLWDADETELVENEIFAWAEKREPYQPKGERETC